VAAGLVCGFFVLLIALVVTGGPKCGAFKDLKQQFFNGMQWVSSAVDDAKIMISYAQVVSQQVAGCLVAPWPNAYANFISKFTVLGFNLMPLLGSSCLLTSVNFYTKLLVQTLGPIAVGLLLLARYMYYTSRMSGDTHRSDMNVDTAAREEVDGNGAPSGDDAKRDALYGMKAKLASRLLWLSYLVFPGASQTTLQAFACKYK
jgi:hypothetical protein